MNRGLGIEHTAHGVCFESSNGALECVAVGVCTAVNGIVPLTGRRTHLVLRSKYIASTTSCRAQGALATQPGIKSRITHRQNAITGFDRDQCYMNCDPISRPTAVGDCLTDWAFSSAPSMPYNGGRVVHALRVSLADDGRGAYVKWRLRSSASTTFYLPFRHRRRRIKKADEQGTPLPLPCHYRYHVPISSGHYIFDIICANRAPSS
jgi:hypothetical protein